MAWTPERPAYRRYSSPVALLGAELAAWLAIDVVK
jgi:hypothetical protein